MEDQNQRAQAIMRVLDDFGLFFVQTGIDSATFDFRLGGHTVIVRFEDGMLAVEDVGGQDWSLPIALLESGAGRRNSKPAEAAAGPTVHYTVANEGGQIGSGRWATVRELVRELHPLRSDLSVVALQPDGTTRGIGPDEAIEMASTIQQLSQAPA
jgi:hypothetical protein